MINLKVTNFTQKKKKIKQGKDINLERMQRA